MESKLNRSAKKFSRSEADLYIRVADMKLSKMVLVAFTSSLFLDTSLYLEATSEVLIN